MQKVAIWVMGGISAYLIATAAAKLITVSFDRAIAAFPADYTQRR